MYRNFFTAQLVSTILNIVFSFITLILGLRVVLQLFNANTSASFVRWVYETSEPLINPFRGMFPNAVLTGGYVIEVNTIIALLVYAFIGYLLGELLAYIAYTSTYYHDHEAERPRRR